jgi:hypothetical protein
MPQVPPQHQRADHDRDGGAEEGHSLLHTDILVGRRPRRQHARELFPDLSGHPDRAAGSTGAGASVRR